MTIRMMNTFGMDDFILSFLFEVTISAAKQ
jgi:hypothetical protein